MNFSDNFSGYLSKLRLWYTRGQQTYTMYTVSICSINVILSTPRQWPGGMKAIAFNAFVQCSIRPESTFSGNLELTDYSACYRNTLIVLCNVSNIVLRFPRIVCELSCVPFQAQWIYLVHLLLRGLPGDFLYIQDFCLISFLNHTIFLVLFVS